MRAAWEPALQWFGCYLHPWCQAAREGTALCCVSWGIPWAAARLLLSLRTAQVCLKHTCAREWQQSWAPAVAPLWSVRGHPPAQLAPAAAALSHLCRSCSLLTLHPAAAVSVSRWWGEQARGKVTSHTATAHQTASWYFHPTRAAMRRAYLWTELGAAGRASLAAAFIMLGNDLCRINFPSTSAGHSFSICAAKGQLWCRAVPACSAQTGPGLGLDVARDPSFAVLSN